MPAPVKSNYLETTSFNTTGASKSITLSWNAGDLIVIWSAGDDVATFGDPTATGLTGLWQSIRSASVVNTCAMRVVAQVAAVGGTAQTVTQSGSATVPWGFAAIVYPVGQHNGIGASTAPDSTTALTNAMTAQKAGSTILWMVADFNAPATGTMTPTPTNVLKAIQFAGNYTIHFGEQVGNPGTTSVPYGLTASTGGTLTKIAVEILAALSSFVNPLVAPMPMFNTLFINE